jgi:holo-[acyl-carrier protein] synthase
MSVVGVGVDLLRIDRIRSILDGPAGEGFVASTFTERESATARGQADPAVSFATRFAIKEAVFKSLGTSVHDGDTLRDIEVHEAHTGAPYVTLTGRFARLLEELGADSPMVSVSSEDDQVVAVAVLDAG